MLKVNTLTSFLHQIVISKCIWQAMSKSGFGAKFQQRYCRVLVIRIVWDDASALKIANRNSPSWEVVCPRPRILYRQNEWIHLVIPFTMSNAFHDSHVFPPCFCVHVPRAFCPSRIFNRALQESVHCSQSDTIQICVSRSILRWNLPEEDEIDSSGIIEREDCGMQNRGNWREVSRELSGYVPPSPAVDEI